MNGASRKELLHRAKDLNEARDYLGIHQLLCEYDPKEIRSELELYFLLCLAYSYMLQHDRCKELLEAAGEAFHAAGDAALLRRWQNLFAIQLTVEGELSRAEAILVECAASAEASRHHTITAAANNGLGVIAGTRGDVANAIVHFGRSLAAFQRIGDSSGVGKAHHNIGLVCREWNRLEEAATHLALAADYFEGYGTAEERVLTCVERALLHLAREDLRLAETLARSALNRAGSLGVEVLKAFAAKALGVILVRMGNTSAARAHLTFSEVVSSEIHSTQLHAEIQEELSLLELADGRIGEAINRRLLADRLYTKLGAEWHRTRYMERFQSAVAELNIILT
jgi:tetratricopeptide (TPR) repeat protein